MAKVSPMQQSFNAGELTPLLAGRPEITKYDAGLEVALNYIPLVQGPITRRPGTKHVVEVKDSSKEVGHDIDTIGDTVAGVKAQTDLLPVDPAGQAAVDAAIAASETAVRGADSDDLKTLSDQLDNVESPAMPG